MLLRAITLGFIFLASFTVHAQAVPAAGGTSKDCGLDALQVCALHVLQDEYHYRHQSAAHPAVMIYFGSRPFAAGTGYTLTQDASIMQDLGSNPGREKDFNSGLERSRGYMRPWHTPVSALLPAKVRHDEHLRETSLLVTEAGVDASHSEHRPAICDQPPGPETRQPDRQVLAARHKDLARWYLDALGTLHQRLELCPRSGHRVSGMAHQADRLFHGQHRVLFPSTRPPAFPIGRNRRQHLRLPHWRTSRPPARSRASAVFSLESIKTANGKGIQISYDFNH